MVRPKQTGFTLVELMVVVAIIGVLATLAVFMFTKQSNKAKSGEVPAMFGEFKLRQEQFHLEHNEYLTTGATDDDLYPTADPGNTAIEVLPASSPVPPAPQDTDYPSPSWQSLRITSDKSALYCGYVAVSGVASDDSTVGTVAAAAPFELGTSLAVPATNWYYLLAQCDFDGDDTNSIYFTLSGREGMIKQNAGE